jgi:hypothetical protein
MQEIACAIPDLDRALTLAPSDAIILYKRGIAKRQSGDATGGESDIARARSID